MQPIGPLMIEHRLIERAVPLMQREMERMEKENKIDREFILSMVDFFRTYADLCHHGKEEDILFKALRAKKLSAEHGKILDELLAEHVIARKSVGRLSSAGSVEQSKAEMTKLIDLYPKHIEKEDKHFFVPVMGYFDAREQEAMLAQMREFDERLIHEKYGKIIEGLEGSRK